MTDGSFEWFIREIAEGLNAITDNAGEWSPEQVRKHAQDLRVMVESAGEIGVELLEALRNAVAHENRYKDGPWIAGARATIAKAEGK